ncbi:MAG: hypothetical protein KGL53_07525, partial [Elusimicrobia bacterium]|nr:hypothetical protein [Elusimicrobiota bacterium]
ATAGAATLHYPAGGATSDDGATAFGRRASTWTVMAVPSGVYSVEVSVPEVGLSTTVTGVSASSGAFSDVAVALLRKATLSGVVVLPSTEAYGTWVTLAARRSGDAAPSRFASVLVPGLSSGTVVSSAVFSLYGLDAGTWTLTARAQDFIETSTDVLVASALDVGDAASGAGGPTLALGEGLVVSGTVTVVGDTSGLGGTGPAPDAAATPGFSVLVEAVEPTLLARSQAVVRLATSSARTSSTFTLTGLAAGDWRLSSAVAGFEASPPGPREVVLSSAGALADLTFAAPASRAVLTVRVNPRAAPCSCAADYRRVAYLHAAPDGTVDALADVVGLSGGSFAYYPSSFDFTTPPLTAGAHRWTFLDAESGRTAAVSLTLTPQATGAALADLSGATYTVTGQLLLTGPVAVPGSSDTVTVSSMAGVAAAAASSPYCLLASSRPVTLSAARVELVP